MAFPIRTILVIDDEAQERRRMRHALQSASYRIIESRDFAEAMALFQRYQTEIDLILVDVSLPGRNGCELAAAAVALKPSVKVLFMSGPAGAQVCRFYGISGTDVHFLKKPFSSPELLKRVTRVLEPGEPMTGVAAG